MLGSTFVLLKFSKIKFLWMNFCNIVGQNICDAVADPGFEVIIYIGGGGGALF